MIDTSVKQDQIENVVGDTGASQVSVKADKDDTSQLNLYSNNSDQSQQQQQQEEPTNLGKRDKTEPDELDQLFGPPTKRLHKMSELERN